jgi:hypothetical protein
MKKLFLFFILISFTNIQSQNVNIPDPNFKNYLLNNTIVNTNNDSQIQVSEALAFTGTLAFQFYQINDLTGIEAFRNLTVLDCGDNNLTSLNLSQNTALTQLYCYDNLLTNLDLSANLQLTSLDCRNNMISDLNVTQNISLSYLQCTFNELVNLDVTQNTNLSILRCFVNDITSLNLLNNPLLTELYCSYNELTLLDLSLNSSLTKFECDYNNLGNLYMENMNNTNVTLFSVTNNPNLLCIQVDDEAYSTTNWLNIDSQTSFSEICSLTVPDFNFNTYFTVYPIPAKNVLTIENKESKIISLINIMNLNGQKVLSIHNTKENEITIDMSKIKSGVYFLQLKVEGTILSKKITVQ